MEINQERQRNDLELLQVARKAMGNAYAPYSNFQVGAALLCENGSIYSGCNIENATYGATNCAERTAVYKAVSEGNRKFQKIAVVSSNGEWVTPCGICRQVLLEFMKEGEVITANSRNEIKRYTVAELLPYGFML